MPLRLRTNTTRRNGKTYRYHQLTRAVRKDGKPSHEVVAHLGRLPDDEADAIRAALDVLAGRNQSKASNTKDALFKLEDIIGRRVLRYLDVMVLHRLWTEWGLRDFFEQHLPAGEKQLAPADVLQVLVLNRSLAPCSKLRVTEWCPRTALPEVLGFQPRQLNNTRIHRVLDDLRDIEPKLWSFLAQHPLRKQAVDSVIFLDITDTHFVGHGGDLSAEGKCKDGSYQKSRIQIALGVDRRGLPIRWELMAGDAPEGPALPRWLDALDALPPFDTVPIVFDRGFSSMDNLWLLAQRKRRFVTCARTPRLVDWAPDIDFASITSTEAAKRPDAATLQAAGLTADPEDSDLFYVDQGVRSPPISRGQLPRMRVIPFFRPSQYAFDTHRSARAHQRMVRKIDVMNAELADARADRDEDKTRARVQREIVKRHLDYDYQIVLHPIGGKSARGKSVRSFRIELKHKDFTSQRRDTNAGWRVLLASADDDRPASVLIRQYDAKHHVEYAFRTIKSFVKLRPVRHQDTPKIKAHVTLCVLAMLLDRWLELQLRQAGVTMAVDRVYENLEPCRLLVLSPRRGKAKHLTISEVDEQQQHLLAALRMQDLADAPPAGTKR